MLWLSHKKCIGTDKKRDTHTEMRWDTHDEEQHIVFESPVWSSLLAPSALDRNRNWSSQFQKLQKTEPNCHRMVFCGYKTSFNRFWS